MKFKKAWLQIIFIIWCIKPALLPGIDLDYALELRNETSKNYLQQSELNPNNILGLYEGIENYSNADFDLKLYFLDNLYFTFYNTAYYLYNEDKEYERENILKQGYVTLNLFERFFIDIGRKVERNGISFYKNPTDFVIHEGELDLSKSQEEQTRLLKGILLLKTEIFLTKNFFLSFIYSPLWEEAENMQEQYLGKIAIQMNSSDIEFMVYYNSYFKYGVNYSLNVAGNFEFHFEGAIYEKQKRIKLREYPGGQLTLTEESVKYNPQFILGGHFTFNSAGNLYFEYFYNHNGYTFSQWQSIYRQIKENKGPNDFIKTGNLLTINDLIRQTGFTYLRRHYLMIRYEKEKILGGFGARFTLLWEVPKIGGLCIISSLYQIMDNLHFNLDFFYYDGLKNSTFYNMYYKCAVRFSVIYKF